MRGLLALLMFAMAMPVAASEPIDTLVAAEREFAASSPRMGVKAAFLGVLDEDAVLFRPGPVDARDWYAARPDVAPFTLEWAPEAGEATTDLGYTYGPYRLTPRDAEGRDGAPAGGHFFSIWVRGAGQPWRGGDVFPNYQGPFIRAPRDVAAPARELVVGQWSLIPWFAKERKLKFPTSNARSEELADKASYKHPWARGQRCVVPAWAFFEPCWESGRHVPWRFAQANGEPWGLAGLWNTWTDKTTGERYLDFASGVIGKTFDRGVEVGEVWDRVGWQMGMRLLQMASWSSNLTTPGFV